MSDLHNKQGEGWPQEVLVGRRKHSADPLRVLPDSAAQSAIHGTARYVPQSKLSEVEADRDRADEALRASETATENMLGRFEREKQRADRLQAIIDALPQQEAVEAAANLLLDGRAADDAEIVEVRHEIQAALQTAKEQVEGKDCERCKGSGREEFTEPDSEDPHHVFCETCLQCNGSGQRFKGIDHHKQFETCAACGGEGQVAKNFGIDSPGRPEIVTCPNCGGSGKEAKSASTSSSCPPPSTTCETEATDKQQVGGES